ncbi:hypothetical protein R3P38DRAFT_2789088 [Favolaschia claudopus]|uniref:Uncharacterized protein n=1 Tax=Favolaschia claudopus TaxID=2862362 RepID=A0AAW0AKP2_9AGAR
MFVFSGATSTGSLDSKLRQVTYDTSSKRYSAPFGLWQRGNDGNYEYAHLQKVRNTGASYCATAAKFWGRLERERWTYAFAILATFKTFNFLAVGASEHLKPLFMHVPENSAFPNANPPPRPSAVIEIDGIAAEPTQRKSLNCAMWTRGLGAVNGTICEQIRRVGWASAIAGEGIYTRYSTSNSLDASYDLSVNSDLLVQRNLSTSLVQVFNPGFHLLQIPDYNYRSIVLSIRRLGLFCEVLSQGCERRSRFGSRVLFNKPFLTRNLTTVYRDYDGRNYDFLNSTSKPSSLSLQRRNYATIAVFRSTLVCDCSTNTRNTETMTMWMRFSWMV